MASNGDASRNNPVSSMNKMKLSASCLGLFLVGIAAISLLHDILVNLPLEFSLKSPGDDPPSSIAAFINIAFALLSSIIAIDSFKKYKERQKVSPFLLFLVFSFLTFTMALQAINTLVSITSSTTGSSLFDDFLQKSVWLFLISATFFQILFIFEIFRDGIFNPRNKRLVILFSALILSIFILITFSLFNDYFDLLPDNMGEILVISGSGVSIISIFLAFSIQASTSFKLYHSLQQPVFKRGALFIGLSGLVSLSAFISEFAEELARILVTNVTVRNAIIDFSTIFTAIASLVGAILIYLGFVYPAKVNKKNPPRD